MPASTRQKFRALLKPGAALILPLNDEQMAAIARLPWPQIANIVIGGKTPERSNDEMKRLGFAGVLYANTALQAAVFGMQRALKDMERRYK